VVGGWVGRVGRVGWVGLKAGWGGRAARGGHIKCDGGGAVCYLIGSVRGWVCFP